MWDWLGRQSHQHLCRWTVGIILALIWDEPSHAWDLRGFVEGEARPFFTSASFSGQKDHTVSLALNPEIFHEFESGTQFYFIPFYRYDHADSERTHFDLRELDFIFSGDLGSVRVGVRKVFWGVTETVHLVDIVNQTDFLEGLDGEDKLGQPMLNVSLVRDWGIIDFFVLPFFRERTFPGGGGRLRPPLLVDTDNPRYESAAEEWHTDFAVRYFQNIGKWDIGLSAFSGTGREPTFDFGISPSGTPVLIPFYEQIHQVGLDLLYIYANWIWKLEVIQRWDMRPEDFYATTFGYEYTFSGVFGTGMDIGVLTEWSYDERQSRATTLFQNDLTFGLRWGWNDVNGTEILFAFIQDVEDPSKAFFIEASSRLDEHWRLTVEVRGIMNQPDDDPFIFLRDEDFGQITLAYHF
ncbi:conserved hypothetical protein [Nitrospina gracilis 3/211]|uniref:Uncharacterized protein n=1 Tax=Nitrospina gracilis (strain 3/211) TaxID=1266370 RepID=M1YGX7_NITG3|nr:conserved hypothetical protein [Nitrospina gracilis 3/211]